MRWATIRAPSGASARQSAWLPWVAPFVRNHERAAPNASAASRSARSYGVGDGPRSMPWMSCGTSAARPSRPDRLAEAGVGSRAALVAGDVVARRPAERVRDDGVEVRGRRLVAGVFAGLDGHRAADPMRLRRLVAFAGMDAEILAAVAAEEAAMARPADRARRGADAARRRGRGPGDHAPRVLRARARAVRRPARPRRARRPSRGAAPFGWDVAGKANVLANWEPARRRRRPLADPRTATSTSSAPSRPRSGAARRSRRGATATGSTGAARAT